MRIFRNLARWKLLPLVATGSLYAIFWGRICVPHGTTTLLAGTAAMASLLAGAVTPKGLWWLAALCICLPAMVTPGYHGKAIDAFLQGFVDPGSWIPFFANVLPPFLFCRLFSLAGVGIRRLLCSRWPALDEGPISPVVLPKSLRSSVAAFALGDWVSASNVVAAEKRDGALAAFLVPGYWISSAVPGSYGSPDGAYGDATAAIANGAIYALAFWICSWLGQRIGRTRHSRIRNIVTLR